MPFPRFRELKWIFAHCYLFLIKQSLLTLLETKIFQNLWRQLLLNKIHFIQVQLIQFYRFICSVSSCILRNVKIQREMRLLQLGGSTSLKYHSFNSKIRPRTSKRTEELYNNEKYSTKKVHSVARISNSTYSPWRCQWSTKSKKQYSVEGSQFLSWRR